MPYKRTPPSPTSKPIQMDAKFDSKCRACQLPIKRYEKILYYFQHKEAYGLSVGVPKEH